MKKTLYSMLGCVGVALGAAGVVLPVLPTVTLLMSVGFFIMGSKGIVTGCIVLICVWIFHLVYFIFGVKTIPTS